MDPNLLPQQLRGQEQKELQKEKRGVSGAGEILSTPVRRGKAAIDDDSFRLSKIQERSAPAPKINVEPQKERHESLRGKFFAEKKVAPRADAKNSWHVPAEHALGDSWTSIIRHPFGRKQKAAEYYLSDKKPAAKKPEATPHPERQRPAITPEKTHEQHRADIHKHFSYYLLWIALPVLFAAAAYGIYLILTALPAPYNLVF